MIMSEREKVPIGELEICTEILYLYGPVLSIVLSVDRFSSYDHASRLTSLTGGI